MKIVKFYNNVALCVCEGEKDWKVAITQVANNLPYLADHHDQAYKTLTNLCNGKVFFPLGYLERILGHPPEVDDIF